MIMMDRFEWCDKVLSLPEEKYIFSGRQAHLYDGNTKSLYANGKVTVTSHRLLWENGNCFMALLLSYVILLEEESGSWLHSTPKAILHLSSPYPDKKPGPIAVSPNNFIKVKISINQWSEFMSKLHATLEAKAWQHGVPKKAGILGIERALECKQQETQKTVSQAFKDLEQLMKTAEDMVGVAKMVAQKIRNSQSSVSENETVCFQSYLLSLGVDDPVTRDVCKSNSQYFEQLAQQIATIIKDPLKQAGGTMTLHEVYCRINRARGLCLLSPDDLLHACEMMASLQLCMQMQLLPSGVLVLQDDEHSKQHLVEVVIKHINSYHTATAEELSHRERLPVALARESLLLAECQGHVCRDETVEGIRFYPNKLLWE